MKIEIIDGIEEFKNLKSQWDLVYNEDSNGHVFSSWGWLQGFFEVTKDKWFVIGVKPPDQDEFAAFFPLTLHKNKLTLNKILQIGGTPIADYTGFVCKPEYADRVIECFSDYVINNISWNRFHLKDVNDDRLDSIVSKFDNDKFNVQEINCVCCPYINLPDTWDDYLKDKLSRPARSKLKRRINKLNLLPGFRSVEVDDNNFDEQVDTLLNLWHAHWHIRPKGYLNIFKRSYENNLLWLNTLYSDEIPLASMAAFKDVPRNTFRVFITAYNTDFANFAPGRVLFANSIKYAIENGYKVYDFLRGEEDYKLKFGAETRFNSYLIISQNDLKLKLLDKSINIFKNLKNNK
jgi:GNAT acetyltransferase-like protein